MTSKLQAALCEPSAVAREQLRSLFSERIPELELKATTATSLCASSGGSVALWLVNMDAHARQLERICVAANSAGARVVAYGSAAMASRLGCMLAKLGARAPVSTASGWAPLVDATKRAVRIRSVPSLRIQTSAPRAAALGSGSSSLAAIAPSSSSPGRLASDIVAIGASTGGPEALAKVLLDLPETCGGIIVAMHTPSQQLVDFAARVGARSALDIEIADEGSTMRRNVVLLAPGDYHVEIHREGMAYKTRLSKGPKVHHSRPAVDVLFHSVSRCCGENAMGIILTGIGEDGVAGMHAMRTNGAHTVAQNEASSAVYGMPRRALETGAAEYSLDLHSISSAVKAWHAKRMH